MVDDVFVIAKRFRSAIERVDESSLAIDLSCFPTGCCGDASQMLGTYLEELGYGQFFYQLGFYGTVEREPHGTHVWIAQNDLVVDITADQFPDIDDEIIVTKSSAWHATLNGLEKGRVTLFSRDANGNSCSSLSDAYEIIKNIASGIPMA